MSPDELSRQYHSLIYAIKNTNTLVGGRSKNPELMVQYKATLKRLVETLEEVEKKIHGERNDQKKQASRWVEKIRAMIVDAILAESLSEDLKERVISSLQDLSNRIGGHENY
mgnify:CR=1 FL=1